jgi:type VI secretion system secreted protein VgrG
MGKAELAAKIAGPKSAGPMLFYSMEGTEGLSDLFRYEIEFLSEHDETRELDLKKLLGEAVTVSVFVDEAKVRDFCGIVIQAARRGRRGRYASYSLTVAPQMWLLTRTRECRIFQDKTSLDVAKAMLKFHGLEFREALLTKTHQPWEFLTQYRESDFDFLRRILAHEGIYFFFEHAAGKNTVVLADSGSSHNFAEGSQNLPLEHPSPQDPAFLSQWRGQLSIQTNSVSLADYDFREGLAAGKVSKSVPAEHSYGPLTSYDFPGHLARGDVRTSESPSSSRSKEDQEHQTMVTLEEHLCRAHTFTGEGPAPGVRVGALMSVRDANAGQRFLVTSTSISVRGSLFESGDDPVEEPYRVSFKALDDKVNFRPDRSPQPLVHGPQTAIVVQQGNGDIWADNFGRVLVDMLWSRKPDVMSSELKVWLRVAQPWAGNGWGTVFIPRAHSEVVVEFIDGDPNRPLITGSVYGPKNAPPFKLPDNQSQTGIRTRSVDGGKQDNFNEIRFEDKTGSEELHIQAERDFTTLVKNDRALTVKRNDAVTVEGEQTLTVTKKVTETFKSDHEFEVSGNQKIEAKQDKTEHVKQAYSLTTDKKFFLKQDLTTLTFESTQVTLDAAKTVTFKRGPGQMVIDTNGAITVSSAVGITLESGPSKIEITPAGIKMTAIQIAAEAAPSKLELGPAMAALSGAMVNVDAQAICSVAGKALLKLNTP